MKKQWLYKGISFLLLIAIVFTAVPMLVSAAGSFKSQNDLNLKLRVDWETDYTSGSDFVSVTAKVYLDHYSIYVGARNNGSISIAGDSAAFSTPAIHQEDNIKKATLLATHTVKLPYKTGETISADIFAKWYFGGVYGGKKVEWVEASGKLTFDGSNTNVAPADVPNTESGADNNSAVDNNNANTADSNADMGGSIVSQQGEIKSNTGTYLNLRAVWNAYDSLTTDGKITYAVELYLDYYSLQMRGRSDVKLTVGDNTVTVNSPAIQETGNIKHSLLLATATYEANAGETVNIKAFFPYNGVYGNVKISDITLTGNVNAK